MTSNVNIGSKVPAFTLDTDGGGQISSSDLLGKNAVIYFYPKDDTSGCTKQAIAFSTLKDQFDRVNTLIVGISADSPQKHDKFKAKHDLTVTLASDQDHQVLEAFGVWREKSMYGRKYMGIERSTFLLDKTGAVAGIWRKVKVPGHAEAVLDAAKVLKQAR